MLEIFLLRHGSTTLPDRYIGATDVALAEKGERQILQLKPHLQQQTFSAIFCSPLKRCVRTAELLELPNTTVLDERLREIDFGLWEKKTFAQISSLYPEHIEAWSRGDTTFTFPQGENLAAFHARVASFAESLSKVAGKRVLVICHGGVIRHLVCAFLRLGFDKYLLFQIRCGAVTTLQLYDQGAVLTGLNRGADQWHE